MLAEREKVSGVVALGVVPTETVERNQDDVVLVLGPVGVGAVVHMRDGKSGAEVGSLPCRGARGGTKLHAQHRTGTASDTRT